MLYTSVIGRKYQKNPVESVETQETQAKIEKTQHKFSKNSIFRESYFKKNR